MHITGQQRSKVVLPKPKLSTVGCPTTLRSLSGYPRRILSRLILGTGQFRWSSQLHLNPRRTVALIVSLMTACVMTSSSSTIVQQQSLPSEKGMYEALFQNLATVDAKAAELDRISGSGYHTVAAALSRTLSDTHRCVISGIRHRQVSTEEIALVDTHLASHLQLSALSATIQAFSFG